MKLFKPVLGLSVAALVFGCGQDSSTAVEKTANAATDAVVKTTVEKAVDPAPSGIDFGSAPGGEYVADKKHAYITFTYLHQGYSNPYLRFRSFDSTLNLDLSNPVNSSVRVDIDVNSIDSGVDIFDSHLRDEQWFNVAKYPRASFNSTSFDPVAGKLIGDLTLKGVTKPVTLDVAINKVGKGRSGENIIGASARGKILRSDWDLGAYAPAVGDEVTLIIEVEFNQM